MGTNKGTNSRAGAGDRSNNQSNQGTQEVKKVLGIGQGNKANNLKGKDQDFYGSEASKATDDYLVSQKKVKVGNYFKKVGGEFVRISKAEGEKLYAKGDPSISRSVMGNKSSLALKYGQSNSAMGSGDPTGIMTSIQISEPMFESQKRTQNIALGAMAIMGAPLAGGFYLNNNKPSNSYDNYLKKFYSTMSSSGIKSSQNNKTDIVSNADQVVDTNTDTYNEKEIVTTNKFKKKNANNAADNIASARSLFTKTNQTITGSMV